MKIKSVKWSNHPVLGELEIDFCNPDNGIPYNNILLVGENGSGKTNILESISEFLSGGSISGIASIKYIANSQHLEAIPPSENAHVPGFYDLIDAQGDSTHFAVNRSNKIESLDNNPINIRFDGCVYSKARADYHTSKLSTATTTELDLVKHDIDVENDFTPLKQLLINIQSQDSNEYAEQNRLRGSSPMTWAQFYPISRSYRFTNAFDNFFEKIKFGAVRDTNGAKEIYFNKGGSEISIDDLSTGEKQIVFRGCYLLRNNKNLSNAVIMVDEPELSMHPKWEQKILSYYKELFSANGTQTAQILFASHSVHVVKEALNSASTDLVIVLSENNGSIVAKSVSSPFALPTISAAETNYHAFDLASNDYHIQLYGYLQDKYNLSTIKICDNFIEASAQYDAGLHAKSSQGQGTTTYNTLSTFVRNQIHHPSGSISFSDEELRTSIELLIKLCI